MSKFPWRKLSKTELKDEYLKLKKKITEPIKLPIPRSIIGYPCSNNFFQKERLSTKGSSNSKYSTIEYWNTPNGKRAILEHSHKHGRDVFNSAVFLSHTPAQFPIVAAAKIYKYFGATKIFDPYAGWGDRCLAAMASDIDYVGVDSNKNLKRSYIDMIRLFDTHADIKFISSKVEDINYEDIDFDFIFTSPPFWQDNVMVECYNGCEDNYEDFLYESLFPIIEEGLGRDIWVCLHLPLQMYNDVKKEFGRARKIIKINKNTHHINDKVYCW
jgi:16S rRNA G966 N2-methylase RsmD